jgi:preprotein translocase subunit SecE
VARQRTRRGRRGDFQAPAAASSARTRARQVKPVGEPKSQAGVRRERRGGLRIFAGESWGELKKVEWPGRRQIVSATIVVIIAVAVVGAYLYVADYVFQRLVRDVILGI